MPKRLLGLCIAFVTIFTAICGRIAYISFGNTYQVDDTYNSYTIKLGDLYTTVYDRKGRKLNNNKSTYLAVIRPNEKAMSELEELFNEDQIADIAKELSSGYPIIKKVYSSRGTENIKVVEKSDSDFDLAYHILDKDTGGLEKYASEKVGSLSVNFAVDAMGRLLSGDEGNVINNNYDSTDGIIISLDRDVQQICENASKSINKGAVVVLDSDTSQILASVSKGDDYLNRAVSAYSVGSVFKIVVCACAVENYINPVYNCTSSIIVNDTKFNCQNNHSHGVQNMKSALANSCNCYFVNLALKLGPDKLRKTALSMGFGNEFEIYEDWILSSGYFPDETTLESKGQLSLVGFGQGKLTDSPMHFASAVACIANGGIYNYPTLDIKEPSENRVISEETAQTIRAYMKNVVVNGTGKSADFDGKTAGKTATAQSGQFVDSKEILYTWFAGFYPYENPKYSIVVMCENGTSGSEDCGPVFRTIVENLEKL